jgi:hypothetical protein
LHARPNAQGIPLTMCVMAHRCKAVATVSLHNRVLNRRPVRALEIEAMETSRTRVCIPFRMMLHHHTSVRWFTRKFPADRALTSLAEKRGGNA